MKEIKTTRTVEEIIGYEANDGTRFRTESECKKYEEYAKGVIASLAKKLIVKEATDSCLFSSIGYDNPIEIFRITSLDDVILANKYFETKDGCCGSLINTKDIGKDIVIFWDYDHCYPWRGGTIDEIIKEIKDGYDSIMKGVE